MDLGFFNLGRFSVRYRNAFGEFPSATLQRWPEAGELTSDGPETKHGRRREVGSGACLALLRGCAGCTNYRSQAPAASSRRCKE
jgi:hypothetical protein